MRAISRGINDAAAVDVRVRPNVSTFGALGTRVPGETVLFTEVETQSRGRDFFHERERRLVCAKREFREPWRGPVSKESRRARGKIRNVRVCHRRHGPVLEVYFAI